MSDNQVPLSTSEIIELAIKKSKDCKDQVPQALLLLNREGKVNKKLDREKKGFIWFIAKN